MSTNTPEPVPTCGLPRTVPAFQIFAEEQVTTTTWPYQWLTVTEPCPARCDGSL